MIIMFQILLLDINNLLKLKINDNIENISRPIDVSLIIMSSSNSKCSENDIILVETSIPVFPIYINIVFNLITLWMTDFEY